MATEKGFWIIEGWKSRAQLYTEGTKVNNLPIQTDMANGRRWIRPGNAADIVRPARFVDTPTGQRFGYGGLIFKWPMVNLSPQMVKHLQETYFNPNFVNDTFFYRGWSNKLTVQTYNRATGEWETYQCFGQFANFDGEAEATLGGYSDLQIAFSAYKIAPNGPDVTLTVTYPPSLYDEDEFTILVRIDNVGDSSTFDDSVIVYDIPNNFQYVSYTGANTNIEYSVNNGVSYSGTPPGDLSTVTHIRLTHTNTINSLSNSSIINVNLLPKVVSSNNVSLFTVNTTGDQNAANNNNSTNLNILAWSPFAISNIFMWYKSDQLVYKDSNTLAINNDPVQLWLDQTINTYDAEQNTLANRPVYKTGGINGLPYIEFTGGSSQYFNVSSLVGNNMDLSVIVVHDAVNSGGATDNEVLVSFTNGGGGTFGFYHIDNEIGFLDSVAIRDGSTYTKFATAQSGLQAYTYKFVNDANGKAFWLDGVSTGTPVSASGVSSVNNATIGAHHTGSAGYYNGRIYEIIVYNNNLSPADLTNLHNYLIAKYSL